MMALLKDSHRLLSTDSQFDPYGKKAIAQVASEPCSYVQSDLDLHMQNTLRMCEGQHVETFVAG